MSGFNRLLKNSVANIINGFSNVILGIVISPFLLNALSIGEFSLWNLILQIGSFFALLGFGGQLAVARFITLAKAKNDIFLERKVIQNGLLLSLISLAIGSCVLFVVYIDFYGLFDGVNSSEIPDADISFLIVSFSFLLGLFSSVYSGYFTGVERNEVPAIVNLSSRIVLGVGIVLSAKYGVYVMACVYIVVNLISYGALYVIFRSRVNWEDQFNNIKEEIGEFNFRKFISYTVGISVFNLSMFLIVGMNGILVGKYAFKQFAYYSLSMTLVTAIVGFMNAALSPIMQPLIRLSHENKQHDIERLVHCLITIIMTFSIISIIFSLYVSDYILSLWVGAKLAFEIKAIFIVLLTLNLIRLIGSPLGLLYLAQAKQNRIMHLPLIESCISIGCTLYFVKAYGMYAVPMGLACAVITILLIYSFKLIDVIKVETSKLKYKIIFIFYPSLMCLFVYVNFSYELQNMNSIAGMYIIVVTASFILLLKKVKSLRHLLGT
jgi:O-antigen/teichoic acid export membrane protein